MTTYDLQLLVPTIDPQNANTTLDHTILTEAGGRWQAFGNVGTQATSPNDKFDRIATIASAAVGTDLHVCFLGSDLGLRHTIRHANGSWQDFYGDVMSQTGLPTGFPGLGTQPNTVTCAGTATDLIVIAQFSAYIFFTTRHANGSWDKWQFLTTLGGFPQLGCAFVAGVLNVCTLEDRPGTSYRDLVVFTVVNGKASSPTRVTTSTPGLIQQLSCADGGGQLHVVMQAAAGGTTFLWHGVRTNLGWSEFADAGGQLGLHGTAETFPAIAVAAAGTPTAFYLFYATSAAISMAGQSPGSSGWSVSSVTTTAGVLHQNVVTLGAAAVPQAPVAQPTPTPVQGVSQVVVQNDTDDQDTLVIWSYDLDTQSMVERGSLGPGDQLTIVPTSGHDVEIIAVSTNAISAYNAQFGAGYSPNDSAVALTAMFQRATGFFLGGIGVSDTWSIS